jgi:hypothetical protein
MLQCDIERPESGADSLHICIRARDQLPCLGGDVPVRDGQRLFLGGGQVTANRK